MAKNAGTIGIIGLGRFGYSLAIELASKGKSIICIDKDSADRLAKKILSNNILDFISLNENIEIVEITIPKRYVGIKLADTDIRKRFQLNVIAIERDENIDINVSPSHVFEEKDAIVVVGNTDSIAEFEK